jgi:hypothetical protein
VPEEVSTANEAMQHAQAAHEKIDTHEDLCAERYAHIHTAIDGVKNVMGTEIASIKKTVGTILKILAWGGTTVFGMLMVVLGFLATRAITNSDAQSDMLRNQIEQLQHPAPAVLREQKIS